MIRRSVRFYLFIAGCLCIAHSNAEPSAHLSLQGLQQDSLVTGIVSTVTGLPIAGVTVSVAGQIQPVFTDAHGTYTVRAGGNDVLRFTSVGYEALEVTVGNRTVVNAQLVALSHSLEEVVVVGYGEQRRANLTGAVSTVGSEELTQSPVPTVSQALVGKMPGITSRAPDGRPGAEARLQIRNLGGPLYVIDGVPSGPQQFNNLNGEDIESLSILKDASAAVYGLRASNGVVLVTTKKGGLNRENRININAYHGWQSLFRFPTPASAADYVRANAEADMNEFGESTWTREEVEKWQRGEPGY